MIFTDFNNLVQNWNEYGKIDPFWSILTDPNKKGNKWDVEEFYRTGEWDVKEIIQKISIYNLPKDKVIALDFGCGTGRLTQALGNYFDYVIGIDVASSMVELANKYNKRKDNCKYIVNNNSNLKLFEDNKFNFILSLIVLQHMEQKYSREYIKEFLRILKPGGILVFQEIAGRTILPDDTYHAEIVTNKNELIMHCGENVSIKLMVKNISEQIWPEKIFNVGNHWFRDNQLLKWDDQRIKINNALMPGEIIELNFDIISPDSPGNYNLEFDLVQEGVCWFSDKKSQTGKIKVHVDNSSKNMKNDEKSHTKGKLIKLIPNLIKFPKTHIIPVMELHPLSYNEVLEIINNNAGLLLNAERDNWAGNEWISYTYFVTKK